jgi:threonine/homoserine/homoserine lactone efflux protein
MDSLHAIFITSFLVALSGALMPGPLLTLTVAESVRGRWTTGPLVMVGHGILELVLMVLLVLGLGGLLSQSSSIKAVGLAGGAALVVMGLLAVRGAAGIKGGEDKGAVKGTGAIRLVLSGGVTSLSNPYWILWWATVGVGYLAMSGRLGLKGTASFFGGHIAADLAWYTFVSVAAATGGKLLGGRAYRSIAVFCGVFLICFGGYFIFRSLTF